eukprot:1384144-Amphidinium_carterae.1
MSLGSGAASATSSEPRTASSSKTTCLTCHDVEHDPRHVLSKCRQRGRVVNQLWVRVPPRPICPNAGIPVASQRKLHAACAK